MSNAADRCSPIPDTAYSLTLAWTLVPLHSEHSQRNAWRSVYVRCLRRLRVALSFDPWRLRLSVAASYAMLQACSLFTVTTVLIRSFVSFLRVIVALMRALRAGACFSSASASATFRASVPADVHTRSDELCRLFNVASCGELTCGPSGACGLFRIASTTWQSSILEAPGHFSRRLLRAYQSTIRHDNPTAALRIAV